ncbi:formylglycine-generating enzyme family protein [Armatimonas sp.]|uniref:formylglycine-generating enzyme family protein n=1 Tax=Armatimonas sp. TaxID=1872638 RepID=UPI0034D984BA
MKDDGDAGKTAPVKRSNRIFTNSHGLSDMSGNVWHWCNDGPDSSLKFQKGGSWRDSDAVYFRCTTLINFSPLVAGHTIGFRLVYPRL